MHPGKELKHAGQISGWINGSNISTKTQKNMIHKADKELKRLWAERFQQLPTASKYALKEALLDLRKDALERSKYCWEKHKAPMALYWKVVGVYAGHLARAIK